MIIPRILKRIGSRPGEKLSALLTAAATPPSPRQPAVDGEIDGDDEQAEGQLGGAGEPVGVDDGNHVVLDKAAAVAGLSGSLA